MKKTRRLLCLLLTVVLALSLCAIPAAAADDQTRSDDPVVFVHGLLGWGQRDRIYRIMPYWGMTTGSLTDYLSAKGYETYAASVGPLSSAWDRACELYAALTGGRADYGIAHAQHFGHARFGTAYPAPLVPGWGAGRPIDLVGHSFGGATARLLMQLLAHGCPEEVQAAEAAGETPSPLFTGGKGNYINSVTTLCAPHNGTTLAYIIDGMNMAELGKAACYAYAGLMGRSKLNGYVDFHLEQFGLTPIPGDGSTPEEAFIKAFMTIMTHTDTAADDMYPERAEEINKLSKPVDGVYYFSYSYQTTRKTLAGTQVPKIKTLVVLRPSATLLGAYSKNLFSDYKIDASWLPNDGLVNVVSARYPFTDEHEDYTPGMELETAKWYVMPTREGDHGTVIGMQCTKSQTLKFYYELTDLIESLPVTD